MIDRLVFGCGRLTGGASIREATRLIDICIDHGVRQFDCAPSYGMGTAEAALGKAVRRRDDCRIVTKLGSARGRFLLPKTWLRRLKRALRPDNARPTEHFEPLRTPSQAPGHWDEAFLRGSLAQSLRDLGRIDALYLHDPNPPAFDERLIGLGTRLAGEVGAAPGIALASVWPDGLSRPVPESWELQAAIDPEWLRGEGPAQVPPAATFHSLFMTARWLARNDRAFAERWQRATAACGDETAPIYLLAGAILPRSRLIFSSANPRRLESFLQQMHLLGPEGRRQDILALLRTPDGAAR